MYQKIKYINKNELTVCKLDIRAPRVWILPRNNPAVSLMHKERDCQESEEKWITEYEILLMFKQIFST